MTVENVGPSPLQVLRTLFASFCGALLLIGVVCVVVADTSSGTLGGELAALLAAGGGLLLQLVGRVVERPLSCDDVATSYRTRFFLRLAFAESAALLAFVLVLLSGNALVYLVGLAVAAYGFARLAPTATNLQREQDELVAQGCGASLVAALSEPTRPS